MVRYRRSNCGERTRDQVAKSSVEVKNLDSHQVVSHLQFGAYFIGTVVDLVFTLVAELRSRRSQDREFRSHGALHTLGGR